MRESYSGGEPMAKDLLREHNTDSIVILLKDFAVEDDDYTNFYIKFRIVESLTDYAVLVAEDNDGGHELELGELPLETTYVAKRDYEHVPIGHDLEREKYDAMIAKLFELLETNDQRDYRSAGCCLSYELHRPNPLVITSLLGEST